MDNTWRYAAVTSAFIATASVASVVAFAIASHAFAPETCLLTSEGRAAVSRPKPDQFATAKDAVTSPLIGASAAASKVEKTESDNAAAETALASEEWIEVVDAVNMRSGASSGDRIIKVQLEGKRLRVAARDGGWVKVVEPETGEEGWVYGKFVESVEPTSRRAELTDVDVE